METLRGLMEKGLALFEYCYAISEGNTLRRHQTPICLFVSLCGYQNLISHVFNNFARSSQKRQSLENFVF